ncbi:MAG: dioxygenase [Actinobacteria bacterium]|nr:dioxygenase [Actinomycetota bacterium]
MPALFIGHGAPPLLDDRRWTAELAGWADALPRPAGILIVSAHWEQAPVTLSATAAATPLVYDFSGFDAKYSSMTYPTPDASALATLVRSVMPDGLPIHEHPTRGLDHGAWVPLRVMYPMADIPVLQLSLPTLDPARLLAVGARLRVLRDLGVLVIGSGFLTHGLPYLRDWSPSANPPGWSVDFDLWATDAVLRGDLDTLADFSHSAPGMPYAHPTTEHLAPLFVALGSASRIGAPAQEMIDGYFYGLAKRSFEVA